MKVLFHVNTLNFRGTTVAVTDYAKYNQDILGNESIIAYNASLGYEKDMGTEIPVLDALKKEFKVIGYGDGDLDSVIDREKADVAYFLKAGHKEEELVTSAKTAIHSVFQYYDPHGTRYAYISEWLSNRMSQGRVPFVPHIVNLPPPNKNYREHFNIKPEQIVFGRMGGYYTFDIPFVRKMVERLVLMDNRFVFLFLGTDPFISHPNVHYITEVSDLLKKSNFINSCDAMIHGRQRGESFGLSIAEFLSQNKPVLAWDQGHDLNHLEMLKNSGTLYNEGNLLEKMINIKDINNEDWTKRVEAYKPEFVMKKFNEVFLL